MTKLKKAFKIIVIILVVICLLLTFLVAPRMFGKPDMSAFMGTSIAHRGYFDNEAGVPENSLACFQAAIENGFAIELDIQLSSDGVAMVFHDADLERMCGVQGKIWEYTADQLKEMKLLGTEETIPTFEETLDLINGQVPILVEYKMDKVDTDVCAYSHELLKDYDGPYAIQCFHPFALFWYRQNANDVPRGQLSKNFLREREELGEEATIIDFLMTNMMLNVIGYPDFVAYDCIDADFYALRLCRFLGAKTSTWTILEPAQYEAVKGQFDLYTFEGFPMQ